MLRLRSSEYVALREAFESLRLPFCFSASVVMVRFLLTSRWDPAIRFLGDEVSETRRLARDDPPRETGNPGLLALPFLTFVSHPPRSCPFCCSEDRERMKWGIKRAAGRGSLRIRKCKASHWVTNLGYTFRRFRTSQSRNDSSSSTIGGTSCSEDELTMPFKFLHLEIGKQRFNK